MRLYWGLGLALALHGWALNTHDTSGLFSELWTMSADKLPLKDWHLRLETMQNFPFEFERTQDSICFQAATSSENPAQIYYAPAASTHSATRVPECCFVTAAQVVRNSPQNILRVSEVILTPLKSDPRKSTVNFHVKYPQNLFKEFYCTAIIDEEDALSTRRTHLPSLSEMSEALSIGFRLNPDPI